MTELPGLITDLAIILGAAALITLIFKKLKQPLVLGYILAGALVGPNFKLLPSVTDISGVHVWAEIGVIFLLFSLGLEFSFKKLVKVGAASSATALFEVVAMLLFGYFTGKMLGWSQIDSIFLGGILSISSTTIIIRALGELGVKKQKFAGLVFGVLVVEDLVAVLLLVLLSTLAVSQQFASTELMVSLVKLGFFLILWFLAGIFLIPTFLRKTQKLMDNETMLIVSLTLCFFMVTVAVKIGFSAALGAFVMGSVLAETTSAEKIEKLISSVKELFGAIFFVSVGMLIDPSMLKEFAIPILIISFVTVFGKIISTATGALISRQPLNHAIKAGMSLSQIGEFSFIIATLGLTLKVTSDFLYPVAVAVSAITTFTTPYLIRLSDPLIRIIEKVLPAKWIHEYKAVNSAKAKNENGLRWVLGTYATIVCINSIIIIALIFLSTNFMFPFLAAKIDNYILSVALTGLITTTLMAPFLWALAMKKIVPTSSYSFWLQLKYRVQMVVAGEVIRVALAVFFLYIFFSRLFLTHNALFIGMAITIILILALSKHLKTLYTHMEHRFVTNLNAREVETGKPLNERLPWNIHIEKFEIPAESSFAGRTLTQLALRKRFKINIVMIERGEIKIPMPGKDERIFPGDNISAISTAEHLEQFGKTLEGSVIELQNHRHSEMLLQKFTVNNNSPLIGKTIHESGIRQKTLGLILGIERNNVRILNPDSSARFVTDDIVWVVREEISNN